MPARRHILLAQYWWHDRIMKGVARYALEHDWSLDWSMFWSADQTSMRDERYDGIIAQVGVSKPIEPLIKFIRSSRLPMVDIQDEGEDFGGAKVIVSHRAIGRMAAEHLLALRFQNFGYVAFGENALERRRYEGFAETVAAAGGLCSYLTIEEFRNKLKGLPRPMAVMAANDVNALEVIRTCLDRGYTVPHEFAVVGVDDNETMCDYAQVPLTSVRPDYDRQGYEAAALLDRLMKGEPRPKRPHIIPLEKVTVRRSTDTLVIPDPDVSKALRFLRDRYREPINVSAVGEELGRGLRRVQIEFRKQMGRTMAEELARLRTDFAKRLLAEKRTKIEVVAANCGFSSRFHFIRAFQRATGKSPSAYRRALRGRG